MIENIENGPDHLSKFDYLYPGSVIDLGPDGTLSLVYFQTCLRENIRGGIVTIREKGSDVEGSIRLKQRLSGCELGDHQYQPSDRRTSAATVFRGSTPVIIIDHRSPRFELAEHVESMSIIELPSALEIFRLQSSSKTVDLSDYGLLLAPGRLYRVESNSGYVILYIDSDANEGRGANAIWMNHNPKNDGANGHR